MRVRETLTEERQIRQKTEAQLNELSLRLEETEKERDRLKAAINIQNQKKERHIPVDELELKEEKLKLQVEIENLKISNNNEIKELEEKFSLEKESMNKQLEETKKELSQQTSESEVSILSSLSHCSLPSFPPSPSLSPFLSPPSSLLPIIFYSSIRLSREIYKMLMLKYRN